jgi:transposase, IS5 family
MWGEERVVMGKQHFKELGTESFFGRFVYERIVPRDHFLVKLAEVIDWEAFVPILLPAYEGLAQEGRPPYSPEVILKMLVITYLYSLSERQTEEVANYNLPIKEFVGLAVDEPAPDHSTLCLFKRRLAAAGYWSRFEAVSDGILAQARRAGIKLGQIQVVDSVHTVADIDKDADRARQEHGKPCRDPQAQIVSKGKRRKTEPDGTVVEREVRYLGYKSHVSLNAETGLITTVRPTPGSAADNEQFLKLLAHDEQIEVGAQIYAGDKAYDDTELHYALKVSQKHSALRLNDYRTQKKDDNKEPWLALLASPQYQQGLDERYKVERKFGEAKRWHRFGRCRYLGLRRYGIQAFLTTIALNVKRIVFLLTQVRFRPPSRKDKLALA